MLLTVDTTTLTGTGEFSPSGDGVYGAGERIHIAVSLFKEVTVTLGGTHLCSI